MKLYGEVFPVEIIHPYLADCEMIMTAGEGVKDFCKVLYRGTRARTRARDSFLSFFAKLSELNQKALQNFVFCQKLITFAVSSVFDRCL